ncbi:MAG: DNA polymerase I [Candidatus Cloacimonetes bacterium]|nr:DNA polymerase I [Candidatus Cloacimonadota bacterium]
MKKTLYLIDGTALVYRSYFAFIRNPLINSKGINTSAILGTINSFLKLCEKYQPSHVAISFDRKEKTLRQQKAEIYKANRPPMPDDLIPQIEPIQNFFNSIGIVNYSKAGYEADDVLATLAEMFKNEFKIVFVTGDKDFCQLVDDDVIIYDPFKDETILPDDVQEKYGVSNKQFIDYLALVGDSADNIPGVSGIGPKKAMELLNQFPTLDKIYENIDDINSDSIRNKLKINRENAYLSRDLAEIIRDVPIEIVDNSFTYDRTKLAKAIPLLQEYELNSIIKKVKQLLPEIVYTEEDELVLENENENRNRTNSDFETFLVKNSDDFFSMVSKLKSAEVVAVDTETTSTDPLIASLVGISLCVESDTAFYISINHQYAENLEIEFVIKHLSEILKNKKIIGHNLKYDLLVLENHGWIIENELFDTMIASYLLNPSAMRHNLDACVEEEFSHHMIPITELIGTGKKQITFDLVEQESASVYAAEDACFTYRLFSVYQERLVKNNLYQLFLNMEMPLLRVLMSMEKTGVYIDSLILKDLSKMINRITADIISQTTKLVGRPFNLNSTQQLAQILFEEMKIPVVKRTKTGASTDNSVLEKLADDYEIARLIIEYRQLTKLNSTYTSALPELINERTGRIHSSFNQTVASTGRLSSSNPNLQNIPVRTDLGKEIRKAFAVENEQSLIIAADYSQIELRLLAIMSGDSKLIDAFRKGKDIHAETASIIFATPQGKITSDERRKAKVINFGILYGMGAAKLSKELRITMNEAKEFIANYFEKFPTIKNFIDHQITFAQKHGYVETIFGRKLSLPDINSKNKGLSSAAERIAVNMPIQGSAADIIKMAMINLYKKIESDPKIDMIIQVHDELVFEIKKEYLDTMIPVIRKEMVDALPAKYSDIVPMSVDIGYGVNWYEAHK